MIFKKGKNQNEDVNASIEQDNNMYREFEEKPSNVDNKNNMAYSNTSNSSNSFNDQPYAYKEKEYKTNTLEEHTTVTNSSRMSKVLLYGFYLIFIVIGLIVFIMIRSNKYEFYLKEEEITVFSGSSYQIELIPKNIRYFDYLNYDYSTADTNVATVDEFGTVTAVGPGTTTLKISISPGFISKTMKIRTEEIAIESIDLKLSKDGNLENGSVVNMNPDGSILLKAIVNDRDDLNANVKYSSSDDSIATVDDFGNVTAKKEGIVTIYGTREGVQGSIEIVVNKNNSSSPNTNNETPTPTPTNSSTPTPTTNKKYIGVSKSSMQVSKGKLDTFKITVKEATGSLKITSSNTKIAKVTLPTGNSSVSCNQSTNICTFNGLTSNAELTFTVTGIGEGTANINIVINDMKASNNTKLTGSYKVAVTVPGAAIPTNSSQNGTSIKLSITGQTTKYVGETLKLSATVTGASNSSTVTWTSSDSSVASVSSTGLVTAKKVGTATITASSNGAKSSCTIIVRQKSAQTTTTATSAAKAPQGKQFTSTKIVLSTTSLTVKKGKTATFTVTSKGGVGNIKITSSNASIAKVTFPAGNSDIPLCNTSENICFFDGLTSNDTMTFTVTGVAAGTAYINLQPAGISDSNGTEIAASDIGKVGILVN